MRGMKKVQRLAALSQRRSLLRLAGSGTADVARDAAAQYNGFPLLSICDWILHDAFCE
jgi:hypothetical protein